MISAKQDRQNLGLPIAYYKRMAEALSTHSYLNKEGQFIKIAKMKKKRLKNLRHNILKDPVKKDSPIYRELVRQIKIQITKGERRPRS